MMGVRQSRLVDSGVTAVLRIAMARLNRDPEGQAKFLQAISPHGGPVLAPHLRGEAPESSRVWTPAEAREAFGDPRPPLVQYADMLREREADAAEDPYTRDHHDPLLEFATPKAEA